jgi:hypothetical protein
MLLNSYLKKLYRTESIGGGLGEDDDVYLPENTEKRKRVQRVVESRPEAKEALKRAMASLNHL